MIYTLQWLLWLFVCYVFILKSWGQSCDVERGKLLITYIHMMHCRPIMSVKHGHATILAPLPAQTTPTHKKLNYSSWFWGKRKLDVLTDFCLCSPRRHRAEKHGVAERSNFSWSLKRSAICGKGPNFGGTSKSKGAACHQSNHQLLPLYSLQ